MEFKILTDNMAAERIYTHPLHPPLYFVKRGK